MKIFNTLSGQKEEFRIADNRVLMYVCGVTVYDDCHIGHAMSYIMFDVIKRYLEYRGLDVVHVQNFTDIDDKIITRANNLGISTGELSGKYIEEYFKDMDALNIKRATIYPKATEEIPKIIEVISGLIEKSYAYESHNSVYYRVGKFTGYGKLSHQKTEDMTPNPGESVDEKESPLDFALWKASKPGEPAWPSPWGKGRPGWHIECSAMALKYLGETIDIHGGGQDLIFPHHENEITQSESYTGKEPFARYWMHNGLLQFSGDKMSKSIGNLVTIKQMLEEHSADAVRMFILSSHYRSPLTFSDENVNAAEQGIERLRQTAHKSATHTAANGQSLDSTPYKQRFIEAMDDDFNTAQAIATLFDLAREINRAMEQKNDVEEAHETLMELAGVMGLTLVERQKPFLDAAPFIELLVDIRKELRSAKQWQIADRIRDGLTTMGVVLEDSPEGTTWKRK